MAGVMLGVLLAALDSTIVGTAMPDIVRQFQGMEHYSWPFTAYMLFSTAAVVISGKLADIYGRKPVFLSGLAVFLGASVLCGMSNSMIMLIGYRGLQGLGGGMLITNAFAIAGELFQGRDRGKSMGMVGSMFGLASILGPMLGGFITDHLGWIWIFYINIPIGIASFALVFLNLPGKIEETFKRRIDFAGIIAFMAFLMPLLIALSWGGREIAWGSPLIIALFGGSLVSLGAFVYIESRAAEPILPLSLFKNRVFSFTAIGAFFSNALFFGAILFLPLYLQEVRKLSASSSGLLLAPMMATFTIASLLSGHLTSIRGTTKMISVSGSVLGFIGCAMLCFLTPETPIAYLVAGMVVLGFGLGINVSIYNLNVQSAFPLSMIGILTGTIQFFRNIGGTVGIAVFGTLLMSRLQTGISGIDWGSTPVGVRALLSSPKVLMNAATLEAIKAEIPGSLLSQSDGILRQVEGILSSGIAFVYMAGLAAAAIALIAGILQPECVLGNKPEKPEVR